MVSVISFQPSTREFVEEAPAGAAEPELSIEASQHICIVWLRECASISSRGSPERQATL
jgi:hypothetical protein